MNKTEFATFTKIQRSSLSDFESGNREPSKEFLKTLGDIGISIDWFLFGNGDMLKARLGTSEDKNLHEKVLNRASNETLTARNEALVVVDGGVEQGVLIPVIAQGLSAGFGFDYEEGEIIRYIKVPAWVARNGRDLVALPVYGNSMEPTISNGDLAICDKGVFGGDGLYILRDQDRGLMFCKRLIWTPGGWTIKSDNPSYEPMNVDDKDIEVIARVIAAIKEVK
ncbi:MAG: hypothetical protein FWB86_11855 [Treponema sp.]|nr:hypothetical protein [Treponema sp.]